MKRLFVNDVNEFSVGVCVSLKGVVTFGYSLGQFIGLVWNVELFPFELIPVVVDPKYLFVILFSFSGLLI